MNSEVEFETREIDEYGDVVNVCHWPTKSIALAKAPTFLKGDIKAVLVEKHIVKYSPREDIYCQIAVFGDKSLV